MSNTVNDVTVADYRRIEIRLENKIDTKADKTETYTKNEIDDNFNNVATELNNLEQFGLYLENSIDIKIGNVNSAVYKDLQLKANKDDTYTKTTIDAIVYSKTVINEKLYEINTAAFNTQNTVNSIQRTVNAINANQDEIINNQNKIITFLRTWGLII